MSKTILMLSALLLTQVGNAMTHDECIYPRLNGLGESKVAITCDVFLEIQRQKMLAEMQQSLRSSLIVDSGPDFTASRLSSGINNRQF